ncbi:hypothetical protein [Pseudomonas viridiflava]|uniref:hypothetical protein n=1 Tax=Pseudomonas viridiflava TaxID=33069 RepID=UPI002EA6D4D0|nr:hypothetical protein [Pseudomonas viridiflava]MEE4662805.1 hypothetical protein [Pseudomonas alliivorans]
MLVPLQVMKRDLEEAAANLERLAGLMEGHLAYIEQRKADGVVDDISTNIESIDMSVERLRAAAAKL